MRLDLRFVPRIAIMVVATWAVAACGAVGHSATAVSTSVPPSTTAYSRPHVRTITSQPLALPQVHLAEQTACLTDAQTIRMAEYYYSMVNGRFATIPELVDGKFLHAASEYYAAIRIGAPAGGYTMLAVPTGPCGQVAVTAARNSG